MPSAFTPIHKDLDDLIVKAGEAVARVTAARDTILNASLATVAAGSTIMETASKVSSSVASSMSSVRDGVASARGSIDSDLGQIETRAAGAHSEVGKATKAIQDGINQLQTESGTKLDDLAFRLEGVNNQWTGVVKDAIEQMRQGILSGEDFITKFGAYRITIGNETKSIREFLDGMDLGVYEQKAQDFQTFLATHKLSLEKIVGELMALNNQYSKSLADAIRLYQQGKLTLQELLREAQRLKEVDKTGRAGNLANELLENLNSGGLG